MPAVRTGRDRDDHGTTTASAGSASPWRWLLATRPPPRGRWIAILGIALAGALLLDEAKLEPHASPCPGPEASWPLRSEASAGPAGAAKLRIEASAASSDAAEPGREASAASADAAGARRTAIRVRPGSASARARVLALSLDVWSERSDQAVLDVVLRASDLSALFRHGLDYEVLVGDVDAVARQERERLATPAAMRPPAPGEFFAEYRDLETIYGHLEALATLRPELAAMETFGASLEGRPLRALRIRGQGPRRLGMVIDGGLHAREWIAMAVPLCVADRLLRGYDSDARLRRFVDGAELVVVPVANPDGYVHTWRGARYWRKNRRGEHGVDLNRNFGVAWGGKGSSDRPRSQVYRGAAPFSEPEAAALRDLVTAEDVDAHIDFHSYGQILLHPWSYTRARAKDHRRFGVLARRMVEAMAGQHGKRYRLMPGEQLYPASGTLLDWVYGERGAISFVIELRPTGGGGFVLPPEQIVPTCDEGLVAVLELGEAVGGRSP